MSQLEKNQVQPVKQFNIRLPDDLHRELKAKCALDGLSLVEVGEELVRAYLANKVKVTRKPR
jgi:predicted HicB family RNase H-like nuclease